MSTRKPSRRVTRNDEDGGGPRRVPYTATPSTIRDVNRSILLNLIRIHQPVSRARLSTMTGIFRSNVSDIVEQLLEQHLVVEKRAKPAGRGRVPLMLRLNGGGFRAIAVSVRPSTTTLALTGLTAEFEDRTDFPTPASPAELVERIAAEVENLRTTSRPRLKPASSQIAISVPGLVHAESGLMRWVPLMPRYSGFNVAEAVERATGIPAAAENDCNLGALAEFTFAESEATHMKDFVFLEIGDVGVGAGIVMNRELYRGHDGTLSAEFGHMVVDPCGPRCSCGRSGCWEAFVCDRATWSRYSPAVRYTSPRFQEMLTALDSGDAAASAAVQETARYLALGISNIAFTLNPERIVIAGQITQAWNTVEPVIARALDSTKLNVEVKPARHSAGELFLYGAAQLALNRVFARPKVGW